MLLDGYVRVSQTRRRQAGRLQSPRVQREKLERWTAAQGASLARVFVEVDQSGARAHRPMLAEVISRVESGQSGGVVVAAFDRFGRSLIDGLTAIERIQSAGGTFVSVNEGLDLRTDTGRLVMRIMFSMGEWELDRLRGRWHAARRHAVARGVHMAARPPTGYVWDAKRRLRSDPLVAPVVAKLFHRRAEGASIRALCDLLALEAVRTPTGKARWSGGAVHLLLKNRVYLGELYHGALVNPNSHEPLIDPTTWHAAQHPHRVSERADRRNPSLLAGLLRCAGCRMPMRMGTSLSNGRRKRFYYCARRFTAGECKAPAWISAAVLEPYVDAAFFTLARRPPPQLASSRHLTLAYKRAARETARFRDSPEIRAGLDRRNFLAGVAVREQRERRAALALAALRAKRAAQLDEPLEAIERRWPALSLAERRAQMSVLIDCVFVFRRELAVERFFVCARGDAPVELPWRCNRLLGLEPFDPGPVEPARPSDDEPAWPQELIRESLQEVLAERSDHRWPSAEQLVHDGRGPLLRQIERSGGPAAWADERTGFPCRRDVWTEPRIRAELDRFLKGRSIWPVRAEFECVGLGGLYAVLARRGRRAWAEEYGLRYRMTGAAAPRWTEPRIYHALEALCSGRASYPSAAAFAAAGLSGLYGSIAKRHGGHDRWAEILGLARASWGGHPR
jgi:DNA invertase Pin-like site-specific DNA recombinase